MFSINGDFTIVEKDTVKKDYHAELQLFPEFPYVKTYFITEDTVPVYNKHFIVHLFDRKNMFSNKIYSPAAGNYFAVQIKQLDTANQICSEFDHGNRHRLAGNTGRNVVTM